MKKLILAIIGIFTLIAVNAQTLTVSKMGLNYNEKGYYVIESDSSLLSLIATVKDAIKTKHQSTSIVVEKSKNNQLIITDLVKGFTKTDKTAGSAYLFDLSYKIVMDFKDGKIRINSPIISIGSQDKFYGSNNQFSLSMGVCGKNDAWSNSEKKFFIYNEKGKLIEKSTKLKLENLFNDINKLIINSISSTNEW